MLSAVVLTKNEEKFIGRLLKDLSFCDESIVVDDYSADKTIQIAERAGAIVYKRKLGSDFASQRNFGLEKAGGEWVLFVDADEIVPPELAEEIRKNIRSPKHNSYYIKRRDIWWGRDVTYGEVWTAAHTGIIRLVQKKAGRWQGSVHEIFKSSGSIGRLHSHMLHYPHKGIRDFLEDVNYYSTLRVRELYNQDVRSNVLQIVVMPFSKFAYTYFLKLGFLDGVGGFVYSFMMSFHSFLVRSKLYLLQKS